MGFCGNGGVAVWKCGGEEGVGKIGWEAMMLEKNGSGMSDGGCGWVYAWDKRLLI